MTALLLLYSLIFLLIVVGEIFGVKEVNNGFLSKRNTTVLKGIAIVLIFICHLAGNNNIRIFTPLGGIGVCVFLILSGYGLSMSYKKNHLNKYWTKRIVAIYPLYLLATIIALILKPNYDFTDILKGVIMVKPIIPYGWYFQLLLINYFSFWIAYRFKDGKYAHYMLAFTSILIFIFAPEIMAEQALSFLIGSMFSKVNGNIRYEKRNGNIVRIILLALVGVIFLWIKQFEIIRSLPQILFNCIQLMIKLPLGLSIIYFVLETANVLKYSTFFYAGIVSFELYLSHGLAQIIINDNNIVSLIIFICSTGMLTCCMYVINTYVSKRLSCLMT